MAIESIDKDSTNFNIVSTVKVQSSVHELAMKRDNLTYELAAANDQVKAVQTRIDELDALIKEAQDAGFKDAEKVTP